MTLREIAANIDKSPENEDDYLDLECIAESFNIYDFYGDYEQDHLKAYWVGRWCSTDAWVGYRMYFFDDEPVAFSRQIGRKCQEDFHWFSQEAAETVKDFVLSFIRREKASVTICDIDEDLGDSYKIDFTGDVIDWDKARYNGQPIELLERIQETANYRIDTRIKIRIPATGEVVDTDVRELDFLFHVSDMCEREKSVCAPSLAEQIQSASSRVGKPCDLSASQDKNLNSQPFSRI